MNRPAARILCVDDEPLNLELLEAILSPRGYEVVFAANGVEALQRLRTEQIDICILDVMMPGMDGFELCRRIKSDEDHSTIPIVMITALDDREHRIQGIEAGAEDYISKPFDNAEVLARIKTLLHIKALHDQLKSARIVADKANLAKSEFLSSMSHELRSPLNAILGFAQLLESDSPPPSPAQKESIAQILHAGWHLLKLINEILDLAKVESGRVPLSREPVSLAEIINECLGLIQTQAQQRGIRLGFPRFDGPCFVLADRIRVKQVLINLLSNAIKYNTEQGMVEVTCTEPTPGRPRVSVRDTGAGLRPEQLGQLFQSFNRLGQEAGGEEGTGIGLVVARRLVELMGGVIGVESTVGAGSVFWFELVSAADPHPPRQEGAEAASARLRTPRGARKHTLLAIEDKPTNRKLLELIIARDPAIDLLCAVNGKSGIEIARSSRPDLILTDINLTDINGFNVLKILRADPETAHIPVIAISAHAMPRDIEQGLAAGFFRYLTKPFMVDEFMDTLRLALEVADQGTVVREPEGGEPS